MSYIGAIEALVPAKTPYGFEIIDSCVTCTERGSFLFCNLPQPAVKDLDQIKSTATYPKGAMLFMEGQQPRGIFILCHGRAKLSTSSPDGKTMILRIADAGEILGLSSVMSARPCEATAELMEPTQANFVRREEFLKFLGRHGEAAVRVAQQLSKNY